MNKVVEPLGRRTTLSCLALQHLEVECVENVPQVRKVMKIGVDMGWAFLTLSISFPTDASQPAIERI